MSGAESQAAVCSLSFVQITSTSRHTFPLQITKATVLFRLSGGLYKGELVYSQSTTRMMPKSEEREKTFGTVNDKHAGIGGEFDSDATAEKRRKNQGPENGDAMIRAEERARYWERRRRNNASAKRSRDAKRARELQTQIKVAFLEKENMRMLAELMAIRQENVYLRRILNYEL